VGDPPIGGEAADPLHRQGIALDGTVVRDVAADDDHVDIGHVPRVMQHRLQRANSVDAVLVDAEPREVVSDRCRMRWRISSFGFTSASSVVLGSGV